MRQFLKLVLVVLLSVFGFWMGWARAQDGSAKTERRKLDQPQEVNGIPCAKDYAWFYADGKLQRCTTSREMAVGVAQVPAGSIVELLPNGKPNYVMMLHDATIGEVTCKGGNRLLGPSEGAMVMLYPSGKLQMCWLAKDQTVQGIPCMNGGILGDGAKRGGGVKFRESGKLESCTLAEDYAGKRRGEVFVQAR
jgi:hypothetical protein